MAANLPSAAIHRHDLADRRTAVADPRVERAQVELEAAALALLDPRDNGVEPAPFAVDLDDVALPDPLRREPEARGTDSGRGGKEARLLHARDATARPGRQRPPRATRAGGGRRSPPGRCGRGSASCPRRLSPTRGLRAPGPSSPARHIRARTARRPARSRGPS